MTLAGRRLGKEHEQPQGLYVRRITIFFIIQLEDHVVATQLFLRQSRPEVGIAGNDDHPRIGGW